MKGPWTRIQEFYEYLDIYDQEWRHRSMRFVWLKSKGLGGDNLTLEFLDRSLGLEWKMVENLVLEH